MEVKNIQFIKAYDIHRMETRCRFEVECGDGTIHHISPVYPCDAKEVAVQLCALADRLDPQ